MAHFVLVHGAWHGAWCWYKLIPRLVALGHRASAIDLPGHGTDRTAPQDVSLAAYVQRVSDTLRDCGEPVILVGHSMGGAVISETAERHGERVAGLVYLAAFLLESGTSLSAAVARDSDREFQSLVVPDEGGLTLAFRDDKLTDFFYADCSDEDVALARACLVPQPASVLSDRVSTSAERWGSLPRSYISCSQDRALPPQAQRQMLERVGCDRVVDMATSHSPFFSEPDGLARHLADLSR